VPSLLTSVFACTTLVSGAPLATLNPPGACLLYYMYDRTGRDWWIDQTEMCDDRLDFMLESCMYKSSSNPNTHKQTTKHRLVRLHPRLVLPPLPPLARGGAAALGRAAPAPHRLALLPAVCASPGHFLPPAPGGPGLPPLWRGGHQPADEVRVLVCFVPR
jgi:hypothetical protein